MAKSAQSSSKRQKLRRKPNRKPNRNGIDRLSNLPEHLLLHILSFLPTETAVKTSVLSKTWQFLWTLVPNLDFHESRSHRGFADFVTRVLLHRRERFIRRFRLTCASQYGVSAGTVHIWVSSVIAQNVQELDIDLGCFYKSHRFSFHFTQQSCKTLVVLKLKSVDIGERLDKVSFPVLKTLHLHMPEWQRRKIKFLPSCFPVLEELDFHLFSRKCEIYDLPKLRSLTLSGNYGLVPVDYGYRLERVNCRLQNLLSLVEANIDVRRPPIVTHIVKLNEKVDETYGRLSVMKVVKAISNIRILRLSYSTIKEIELASSYSLVRGDDIPVFHNLVRVELPFIGCAREIMIIMLQKFENLKCLTLCYKGVGDWECGGRGVDMKELIQQTLVPNCLTSRLTTFCFQEFEGTDDEMIFTKYVLKNSLVLKNMTILFSSSLSSEDDMRLMQRKLCKSRRGSEGCRLEFRWKKKIIEAV